MFIYIMNSNIIIHLILIIIALVIIDSIWMYTIHGKFNSMIKQIQGQDIKLNWPYVILIYIVIAGAIYYFTNDCKDNYCVLLNAFVFGITSYAVFDLTNLAIFKDWDLMIAIADIIWGGVLCSSSAYISIRLRQML